MGIVFILYANELLGPLTNTRSQHTAAHVVKDLLWVREYNFPPTY